jgi:hypothetical protein
MKVLKLYLWNLNPMHLSATLEDYSLDTGRFGTTYTFHLQSPVLFDCLAPEDGIDMLSQKSVSANQVCVTSQKIVESLK